jgi:hypothetical protein
MMQTDVLSATLSASGVVCPNRTRVRTLVIQPSTTAGSILLSDGATGQTRINIPTLANGQTFTVPIPGEGVLFYNSVYATISNAEVIAFYG